MALIPDDVKQEIRDRSDIVAVIGQHVKLRKAGQNHKGLCPFHNEKTPSFNVNADKQFFYCFGCQKKGDVFTFLMEYEGKSFVESAKSLAARCGVTIPERPQSSFERRQRTERGRMFDANRLAAQFFRETLSDPAQGEAARHYLQRRRIGDDIAETFYLGYAPDDWRALGAFLERKRVPAETAERVGLIVKQPKAGGYYDRFRNRLMCPIVLPGGETAGFSGRTLARDDDDKAGAKYINSPESPVYKKSKLLFGLHLARPAFRRTGRAILVEGNFDVISLHQAGFQETVAPLGTALTEQQVHQLRRLTDEVILLYDGDRAGHAAAMKSLELFIAADVAARIALLPPDSDPDSIVAQGGPDALRSILSRSQPGIEYLVHEVWRRAAQTADGRSTALAEAARVVQKVANPTKRDLITGTLATAMGVDPGTVRRAMGRRPGRGNRHEQPDRHPHPMAPPSEMRAPRAAPPPRDELELLAILADHPDLMATVEQHDVVNLLTDARLRDMYCAARQGLSILEAAPDDISPLVAKYVLAGSYASVKDPSHSLNETMVQLRRKRRTQRVRQLQRQAEDAKRRGDKALERQLVGEILTIRKQVD